MFCTSLRRRSFNFASILPKFTASASLSLRENELNTHDIALHIGPRTGANTRQLRVLLFSPSTVSESKTGPAVERIQHLSHLTGGQDIAIVFLISPPIGGRFAPATDLVESSEDRGTNGMLAYCKLQAELTLHPEFDIPILPLSTLDALPALLQSHLATAAKPMRVQPPVTSPLQLLQHCTTTAPLPQQTAFLLSDTFESIRELAEGCCMALTSAPELTSSSSFTEPSRENDGEEDACEKLKRLKNLINAKEWEDLVVFWQQEWAMD